MTANQPGKVVYFLIAGTVKITVDRDGHEAMLNVVGPGEVLGEISIVDGLGHSANVITIEPASLLWMDRETFHEHLLTMPRLTYNVSLILARRLRLATSRIEMLSSLDVPARVSQLLVDHSKAYGEETEPGNIYIPMRLTQGEIGALVCATRARVNQVLTDLRRRGVVSIDRQHHITIHNLDALSRRCG